MGTFKAQLQDDLDVFFDTDAFATAVVYTPVGGGDAVTIPAVIDYGDGSLDYGKSGSGDTWSVTCAKGTRPDFDRGRVRDVAVVTIKASDVSDPQYRDTILIDGEVWTVTDAQAQEM